MNTKIEIVSNLKINDTIKVLKSNDIRIWLEQSPSIETFRIKSITKGSTNYSSEKLKNILKNSLLIIGENGETICLNNDDKVIKIENKN